MKFIDISWKIDAVTLDAIAVIKRVAEAIGVPFFLVEATARDFLLEYLHEMPPSRATLDIDFKIPKQCCSGEILDLK